MKGGGKSGNWETRALLTTAIANSSTRKQQRRVETEGVGTALSHIGQERGETVTPENPCKRRQDGKETLKKFAGSEARFCW